ncbi:helix-turn-helix transcriptional regulator [Celeribacter sp.]|uniref:helix-turn-helix transcriptional regulator n=1 Tax=Celeribacter sp. TaxID=1890673 RepID=UPI003A94D0E9
MDRSACDVSIAPVSQATAARFTDLYFRRPFLIFIRSGSKVVTCPLHGEIEGREGDVMIFPPGVVLTMENRPLADRHYQAEGVNFSDDLIEEVFTQTPVLQRKAGIQILRAASHQPQAVLRLLKETLATTDLPPEIRRHRLLEPLIWLKHQGVVLPLLGEDTPHARVRELIERDLSHDWRAPEVARDLGMSEATLRRWLAKSGHGFSGILLNTRLERGLGLLQTTGQPISEIALDCGFKTPSHFSDAFKKRFGIPPKSIRTVEA